MLLRMAFWIGLGVLLMPTDEKSQTRLIAQAQSTLHWTWTFCDRNAATCKSGAEAWATFAKKAEFGFSLAMGMAKEWSEKGATQTASDAVNPSPIAPAMAPVMTAPQPPTVQKLRREDMLPPWRGPAATRTGA